MILCMLVRVCKDVPGNSLFRGHRHWDDVVDIVIFAHSYDHRFICTERDTCSHLRVHLVLVFVDV